MKTVVPLKLAGMVTTMVCLWSMVEGVANTNISSVTCDDGKYTSGDPFYISLVYVVQDLETLTSTRPNYEFHNISPYPNAFAYGHAACNPNLIASDCKTCLGAAKTAMFGECLKRKGARVVLHDCTIRYEQYPFAD